MEGVNTPSALPPRRVVLRLVLLRFRKRKIKTHNLQESPLRVTMSANTMTSTTRASSTQVLTLESLPPELREKCVTHICFCFFVCFVWGGRCLRYASLRSF